MTKNQDIKTGKEIVNSVLLDLELLGVDTSKYLHELLGYKDNKKSFEGVKEFVYNEKRAVIQGDTAYVGFTVLEIEKTFGVRIVRSPEGKGTITPEDARKAAAKVQGDKTCGKFVQVYNSVIDRWVKIDRNSGKIVEYKETPGPYEDILKHVEKQRKGEPNE